MPDRPLTVHCSGLGGGLLSPDHDYDLFFQNHAQMKVYGPSLAMTDDWEQRITQLGLTKTTHEYAIYQLFSTALGWSAWKVFLPDRFANLKLLITRAIRLLTAATIRPAHARPPHPTWVTAVRQIFRCYPYNFLSRQGNIYPKCMFQIGKCMFQNACAKPSFKTNCYIHACSQERCSHPGLRPCHSWLPVCCGVAWLNKHAVEEKTFKCYMYLSLCFSEIHYYSLL